MASKLSRSWSFFSGSGKHTTHHFKNDDYYPYQPNTNTRVNLEERFRRGPPPTQRGCQNIAAPEGGIIDLLQRDARFQPRLENPQAHHRSPAASATHSLHPHQKRSPHSVAAFSTSRTAYDENAENLKRSPPRASIKRSPYGHSSTFPRQPFRRINSTILWNNIQENVTHIKPQTTKLIKEGGHKMNKVVQGVRTSIASFSQRFRNNTQRRYKLDRCETPIRGTPSRIHTPGKLYSPFNVSTPLTPHSHKHPKRLQNHTPRRINYGQENRAMGPVTPLHNRILQQPQKQQQWVTFQSPSRNLRQDTESLNQGLRELESLSNCLLDSSREKWKIN